MSMTSLGLEPETFKLVAYRLNNIRYSVPLLRITTKITKKKGDSSCGKTAG
jgi:hypothetical protein